MSQRWKVILVLFGIFVAGGVTGGFITLRVMHERFSRHPVPEEWAPRHLRRLANRLELTPEQQEQIRPIVRRHMELLNRVRSLAIKESQLEIESMQREVAEKLTPAQRARFEQMNRELREAREAREKAERAKRAQPDHKPGGQSPPAKPPGT